VSFNKPWVKGATRVVWPVEKRADLEVSVMLEIADPEAAAIALEGGAPGCFEVAVMHKVNGQGERVHPASSDWVSPWTAYPRWCPAIGTEWKFSFGVVNDFSGARAGLPTRDRVILSMGGPVKENEEIGLALFPVTRSAEEWNTLGAERMPPYAVSTWVPIRPVAN
jgi:hypothetical protein